MDVHDLVDTSGMPQIPDEVRQQVVNWPQQAPHGAVEAFCVRHGVSRAWFYKVRRLAQQQGQAAMVKASTRPRRSPTRLAELTSVLALAERARLRAEGKDYGPDSVRYALKQMGADPLPSRSTLVRIFDRAEVVDRNRKKRPKRAFRRFAARFPNQRWQADAFTETLAEGAQVTVIEIIDDATRYSLASIHRGSLCWVCEALRITDGAGGHGEVSRACIRSPPLRYSRVSLVPV